MSHSIVREIIVRVQEIFKTSIYIHYSHYIHPEKNECEVRKTLKVIGVERKVNYKCGNEQHFHVMKNSNSLT